MIRSATARAARAAARVSVPNSLRITAQQVARRNFSAARVASKSAGADLAAALRAEQKLEKETAAEVAEDSALIADWSKKNGFEIIETAGNDQVQLVKSSPSETIRVFFSISDVVNAEGLLDESSELAEGAAGEGEVVEENEEIETPVRINIVVEKPQGALGIEGVVQDDLVLVESLIPYASSELALQESAEADYARRQTYQGPPFGVLDPSVQAAVQEFLEANKLDSDFALFVQEYASFRENQEYIDWLGKIATIVE